MTTKSCSNCADSIHSHSTCGISLIYANNCLENNHSHWRPKEEAKPEPLSACCNAEIRQDSFDENFPPVNVCTKCGCTCDEKEPAKEPEAWEKEFDLVGVTFIDLNTEMPDLNKIKSFIRSLLAAKDIEASERERRAVEGYLNYVLREGSDVKNPNPHEENGVMAKTLIKRFDEWQALAKRGRE